MTAPTIAYNCQLNITEVVVKVNVNNDKLFLSLQSPLELSSAYIRVKKKKAERKSLCVTDR